MKYTKKICLIAGAALIGCALICGCGSRGEQTPAAPVTVPAVGDTKQPSQYTWAEYQAMTEEQKLAFQKKFGSTEVFEAWKEKAQWEAAGQEYIVPPWENGGKQPADYTWAEFEALSAEHQMIFQNTLGEEAFEAWLNQTQGLAGVNPWDQPGAKQPADYTWAEFEALSSEHQMIFQNTLGEEAFEAWLNQAQGLAGVNPWDQPGAKQPADYTWAEFEALSAEHQMTFQNALGEEAFEAWLNQAQGLAGVNPWDQPGAKQPADYTWAEFEALSAEHQMTFQNALGEEAFEAWLNRVNP